MFGCLWYRQRLRYRQANNVFCKFIDASTVRGLTMKRHQRDVPFLAVIRQHPHDGSFFSTYDHTPLLPPPLVQGELRDDGGEKGRSIIPERWLFKRSGVIRDSGPVQTTRVTCIPPRLPDDISDYAVPVSFLTMI